MLKITVSASYTAAYPTIVGSAPSSRVSIEKRLCTARCSRLAISDLLFCLGLGHLSGRQRWRYSSHVERPDELIAARIRRQIFEAPRFVRRHDPGLNCDAVALVARLGVAPQQSFKRELDLEFVTLARKEQVTPRTLLELPRPRAQRILHPLHI